MELQRKIKEFKSKIDWKIVNMVLYNLTKYEDIGFYVSYWIMLEDCVVWSMNNDFDYFIGNYHEDSYIKWIKDIEQHEGFTHKITFDRQMGVDISEERKIFDKMERMLDSKENIEIDYSQTTYDNPNQIFFKILKNGQSKY